MKSAASPRSFEPAPPPPPDGKTPPRPRSGSSWLRFGIFHRASGNFVAECQTREEAEAELGNWQDCVIVDLDEVFEDV